MGTDSRLYTSTTRDHRPINTPQQWGRGGGTSPTSGRVSGHSLRAWALGNWKPVPPRLQAGAPPPQPHPVRALQGSAQASHQPTACWDFSRTSWDGARGLCSEIHSKPAPPSPLRPLESPWLGQGTWGAQVATLFPASHVNGPMGHRYHLAGMTPHRFHGPEPGSTSAAAGAARPTRPPRSPGPRARPGVPRPRHWPRCFRVCARRRGGAPARAALSARRPAPLPRVPRGSFSPIALHREPPASGQSPPGPRSR